MVIVKSKENMQNFFLSFGSHQHVYEETFFHFFILIGKKVYHTERNDFNYLKFSFIAFSLISKQKELKTFQKFKLDQ